MKPINSPLRIPSNGGSLDDMEFCSSESHKLLNRSMIYLLKEK